MVITTQTKKRTTDMNIQATFAPDLSEKQQTIIAKLTVNALKGIEDFQKAIASGQSITQVIEWNGERAVICEKTLMYARYIDVALQLPNPEDCRLAEGLEGFQRRLTEQLLEFRVGGSTSAQANIHSNCDMQAIQLVLSTIAKVLFFAKK
jgi:hypothetical protein